MHEWCLLRMTLSQGWRFSEKAEAELVAQIPNRGLDVNLALEVSSHEPATIESLAPNGVTALFRAGLVQTKTISGYQDSTHLQPCKMSTYCAPWDCNF